MLMRGLYCRGKSASETGEFNIATSKAAMAFVRCLGASQHLWGRGYWVASSGNVTDEVWAEYIKNLTAPEPDDDSKVT